MADEPIDLVLEHLKRIQGEIARVHEDQRTQGAELSAVRQILGAHGTLLNQIVEDVAGMRARLDRIERRLDLVEVAK
jgi:septal ring factor EnvC (AmiA/AmiB activator)